MIRKGANFSEQSVNITGKSVKFTGKGVNCIEKNVKFTEDSVQNIKKKVKCFCGPYMSVIIESSGN